MGTVVCLCKLSLSRGRKHCTGSKCVPFISAAGLVVVCHMVCECVCVCVCIEWWVSADWTPFIYSAIACTQMKESQRKRVCFVYCRSFVFSMSAQMSFHAKPRSKVKLQLRQMQSENTLISANVEECVQVRQRFSKTCKEMEEIQLWDMDRAG